ncbi:MAG TPA: Gfo/Idh/MocA family oxidoreductase [Thermogutta sp.]|nr:Gfo/Idh/MocA family oxidoreductase [Thermogutta sp.]HPU05224.1 Gfo/Idh/MocA family oxidoreductase [Thermogutta sp.]HQF14097.1 Gfo/Idh/MocA family oxidoreductase [Thermogutta sp.]
MQVSKTQLSRRRFLRTVMLGSGVAVPMLVSPRAMGFAGLAPASERIILGAIGIGNRGTYVLACFLQENDVECVAVADVKLFRREQAKRMVDERNGNTNCKTYRDFRELLDRPDIDAVLIATGPNWHWLASVLAAKAGKDVYCEKPCTKNIMQSLSLAETFRRTGRVFQAGTQRRNLPHFAFAVELAQKGRLGKLHTLYAHPAGMSTSMSGWAPPEPEPNKEEIDWDLYLGPAAWRPFNKRFLDGFNFEKGGGLVGGGVLEWGSHCVDLCQWANQADHTAPVEYFPPENGQVSAVYANGVRLILRETGWLPLGSCPVRFEGDKGWVEAGDSGKLALSSPALLAGRKVAEIGGYPATFHVRDFLDCVKTRGKPKANADVACHSHITCHAVNIAIFLNRKLRFDPVKYEFIGDDEANRLRGEALREPWRV